MDDRLNLVDRTAALLGSGRRQKFFALLASELSIGGRDNYPNVRNVEPARTVPQFQALNEAVHVLANQLLADALGGERCSDSEFAASLIGKARLYDSGDYVYCCLLNAVERAESS